VVTINHIMCTTTLLRLPFQPDLDEEYRFLDIFMEMFETSQSVNVA